MFRSFFTRGGRRGHSFGGSSGRTNNARMNSTAAPRRAIPSSSKLFSGLAVLTGVTIGLVAFNKRFQSSAESKPAQTKVDDNPQNVLRGICKGKLQIDPQVLEDLARVRTKNGVSLAYCCKSGNENPDSSIGFYAGDLDTYYVFSPVTNAIIKYYHGTDVHRADWTVPNLEIPADFPKDRIRTSRIRVARNLADYPFPTTMSLSQRLEVERKASQALLKKFGGEYYTIAEIQANPELKNHLKGVPIFHNDDHYLESSGTFKDWPAGRGIYFSDDKSIVVWIGEEDHLRVQSFQKGFALKEAFVNLKTVLEELERHLTIATHPRLGYINACPTNCGTGMRLSVHLKLDNIGKDIPTLMKIAGDQGMAVRPEGGEASSFGASPWVDISNKVRLGVSESKIVEQVFKGIIDLVRKDQNKAK